LISKESPVLEHRTVAFWGQKAMQATQTETQKRIVEQLSFGSKTSKRVRWEAWSLKIVDPRKVEVTNESYGFEKDEHQYVVTVEERGNLFVPVECECPADEFNDDYDCKHKVAVATIGGPVVLGAAMAYTSDESEAPLRADGGLIETDSEERPDDCGCWDPEQGLPCWPCYRDGFEEPNPDVEGDE
jgi:hypothetical protein